MKVIFFLGLLVSAASAAVPNGTIRDTIRAADQSSDEGQRAKLLAGISERAPKDPDDVRALHEAMKALQKRYRGTGDGATVLKTEAEAIQSALSRSTDKALHAEVARILDEEERALSPNYFGEIAKLAPEGRNKEGLRIAGVLALIEAAGLGKDEDALPALRKFAEKEGITSQVAIRSLGMIGKQADLDRMIEKIKQDPSSRIDISPFGRVVIGRVMKEIDAGGLSERQANALIARLDPGSAPVDVQDFMPLLHHKNPRVSKTAARVIARGGVKVEPSVIAKMLGDSDRQIRFSALASLERQQWAANLTPIVSDLLLHDKDEGVREQAAYLLGVKQVREAEDVLKTAIADPSRRVSGAAQAALDRIAGKEQQEVERDVHRILNRNRKQ